MSDTWAVVIAAVSSSFLTSISSLGITRYQHHLAARAGHAQAVDLACAALVRHSEGLAMRTRALIETARVRSGLAEGIAILLYQRKPVEPRDVFDYMAEDWTPLSEAAFSIRTLADPALVSSSETLLSACARIIDAVTAVDASLWSRVRRSTIGADVSASVERWEHELNELGIARASFSQVLRQRAGLPGICESR